MSEEMKLIMEGVSQEYSEQGNFIGITRESRPAERKDIDAWLAEQGMVAVRSNALKRCFETGYWTAGLQATAEIAIATIQEKDDD